MKGAHSPQVVSAPSGGVPPARLRVAMGETPEGFPEFFPFTSRVCRAKAPFLDESPALTAVLQAQRSELYQSRGISHSQTRTVSAADRRNAVAAL